LGASVYGKRPKAQFGFIAFNNGSDIVVGFAVSALEGSSRRLWIPLFAVLAKEGDTERVTCLCLENGVVLFALQTNRLFIFFILTAVINKP
jgi:hypothetical protein